MQNMLRVTQHVAMLSDRLLSESGLGIIHASIF